MQLKNWNDLRYLLALKRVGSIAAAARTLGVDATTLSRRLTVLQESTGMVLVQRNSDGSFQLTAAGETFVTHAERVEHHIEMMEDALGSENLSVSGTVRVTSVPVIVNHVLVAGLQPLLDSQPSLQIELIPESRSLSLTEREVDIALRLSRPLTGGNRIKSKKLAELRCSVYSNSQQSSVESTLQPWIIFDDTLAHLATDRWLRRAAATLNEPLAGMRVRDIETALQAVLAGVGKSLLPDVLARKHKELCKLEFQQLPAPPSREIWLLFNADQAQLRRTRLVLERLIEVFS